MKHTKAHILVNIYRMLESFLEQQGQRINGGLDTGNKTPQYCFIRLPQNRNIRAKISYIVKWLSKSLVQNRDN